MSKSKSEKAPRKSHRKEGGRRYRPHTFTPTHFIRLRLPRPRVEIDLNRRWYGVRTLGFLQSRLQKRLRASGFEAWFPTMAIHGGAYWPVGATVMVGVEPEHTRDDLWAWHDLTIREGRQRPFFDIIGPIDPGDLQIFADWLTGCCDEGDAELATVFRVGESISVLDGPFASFDGVVEEVDNRRRRVKAAVSIFGRHTPVELTFAQVERAVA